MSVAIKCLISLVHFVLKNISLLKAFRIVRRVWETTWNLLFSYIHIEYFHILWDARFNGVQYMVFI